MLSLPKTWQVLALLIAIVGCGKTETTSNLDVTEVDHTAVKRQSIGNCWLYAQATWMESLLKTHADEDVNVSESYWTYWHWYEQIVGTTVSEVSTGGFWDTSRRLIANYGWVAEGDFIPAESDWEMSRAQAGALAHINRQLEEGGTLASFEDRTPENVKRELDRGFNVKMDEVRPLAHSAHDTMVGESITLYSALFDSAQSWKSAYFPRVYGEGVQASDYVKQEQDVITRRVRRALNDHKPVVMTVMIDFNALDIQDATFKASLLEEAGMGSQGGHMVVLSDYTVDDVPGIGYVGEGVVDDETQVLAAEHGRLLTLKAKNSWGTDRPDRGLTDGYTSFDWAYLTQPLEWKSGYSDESTSFYGALSEFILPPGY